MDVSAQTERHETIRIDSLDKFRILSNYMLCKPIPYNNITKSGIIISAMNTDQYVAQNCTRVFEIIRMPDKLRFKGDQKSAIRPMEWKTDIEVQHGDRIWVTAFGSVNSVHIDVKGEIYALIHYEDVRAAKRGDNVITVNGQILCEEIEYEETCLSHTVKRIDNKKLKVLYPAKSNDYYIREYKTGVYTNKYWDKHLDLKKGNIVIKLDERMGGELEDELHRTFEGDKRIIYIQSRYIGGLA